MAALEKGLQDLEDLCDVVADEFSATRDAFNKVDAPRRAEAARARQAAENEKAAAAGRLHA
jgi:ectoine hydroxylase-related dioxygenase (phytanoyl-CoA dioxygenase family)